MGKNEPTLVPEWLRITTSDASTLVHNGRHRNSSRNISDFDSAFFDRSSSLNSRSCSNGSAKHAYSSFSMSRRDKDRDRDKERSRFGNHWTARDSSDPVDSILPSRFEKLGGIEIDRLQHSRSMVYGKQGQPMPERVVVNSRESGNSNHYKGNGLVYGGTVGNSINKVAFEKDFPSLGTEERQGVPEIARVSSPGFGSASQTLPVGNSALIGGEGWTSVLAEVPTVGGSSDTGSLPSPGTVSTSDSGSPSFTTGLNMAEALAQAPSRTHTAPKLSVKTRRCEELAIKQSRQLIPVTPAMPKGSVLNSVDKSKAKTAGRTSDMNITAKSGHQQYSLIHHGKQSSDNGHVKPDMPKTGKLLVLKPGWENEASLPTQKDVSSPTTNANSKVTTSQHAVAVVSSASARNLNNPKLSAGERNNPIAGFTVEKKPSLAQTRSRNDFFNLLKKKKTLTNSSAGLSDSDPHISSPTTEKSEVSKEVANASAPARLNENYTAATSNGGTCQDVKRFSNDDEKDISTAMVYPEEKEAAFLRSLGWEENSGEDEGLTEEEINAFYQECKKLSPSLKLYSGLLPKLAQSFATTNLDGASSESSSPDSIF